MMQQQQRNAWGYGGGTMPQRPTLPKMDNPAMNNDKFKKALQKDSRSSFEVTLREQAAAVCTHKNVEANSFATVFTGKFTPHGEEVVVCEACEDSFAILDNLSEEDCQAMIMPVINLIQTSKLFGVDVAGDFLGVYGQMIPYLKQLPKVYEICVTSLNKFMNNNGQSYNNANGFNIVDGILGGTYRGGMAQNPMYGYNQQSQYANSMNMAYNNPMNNIQNGIPMDNMQQNGMNMNTGYGFGGNNQQQGYQATDATFNRDAATATEQATFND